MKTQELELKDVLLGAEAVLRIAKEEKSGNPDLAWQFARMQRKIMGVVGEGTPFEFARTSLMRQHTTLIKAKQPDGTETEHRIFPTDEARQKMDEAIAELQKQKVILPRGFLSPKSLPELKLDRPVSGGEIALAWWVFDPDAMDAMEKQIDGATLDAPVPAAG